jgi:hypothetical protein
MVFFELWLSEKDWNGLLRYLEWPYVDIITAWKYGSVCVAVDSGYRTDFIVRAAMLTDRFDLRVLGEIF